VRKIIRAKRNPASSQPVIEETKLAPVLPKKTKVTRTRPAKRTTEPAETESEDEEAEAEPKRAPILGQKLKHPVTGPVKSA